MTNQEKEESGQIPPKIKLKAADGSSTPQGEAVNGDRPAEAKPISAPKSDTSRVDIPQEELEKHEQKSRNDETMRVVLPKADDTETGTLRKKNADKPRRTIKIKRPEIPNKETEADESREVASPTTDQAQTIVQAKPSDKPKSDTSRVDISKAQTPPSQEQVEVAKDETMEVILEEISGKGDTGKVETGAKPPRTVKIKRSDAPDSGAETVQASEEEKSATAKLDLPDATSQASGGKKTIRIKRAGAEGEAGTGKTLKISRPDSVKATPLPTIAEEGRAAAEAGPSYEVGVHTAFTAAAMLTVIVSGVLIYLMCTQMPFGDSLPWPGKIITEWQGSTRMI